MVMESQKDVLRWVHIIIRSGLSEALGSFIKIVDLPTFLASGKRALDAFPLFDKV